MMAPRSRYTEFMKNRGRASCFLLALALISASCGKSPKLGKDVEVKTFGAVANDGKDDHAAIQAAINSLQDNDRLIFASGTYDIDLGQAPTFTALGFYRLAHIEVVGNGALMLLRGFDGTHTVTTTGVFAIADSSDIELHDLVIDMERPPFSVGRVTEVSGGAFTVDVAAEFPVSASALLQAVMSYHGDTGLPNGLGFDLYFSDPSAYVIQQLAPQKLKITVAGQTQLNLRVGDKVVLRHQVYGFQGFDIARSQRVKIHDATVYAVPGMGLYASGSADITIDNFQILNKPGTERLMSATADGLHFDSCTGMVKIDHSTLEGLGDDGVIVHANFFKATQIDRSANKVTLVEPRLLYVSVAAGDTIEFFDNNLVSLGTATLQPGTTAIQDWSDKPQTLILDQIPAGVVEGTWLSNRSHFAAARITNTTVRNNRARGFMLLSHDVVLDHCMAQNSTGAGAQITAEVHAFFSSTPADNVVISNCTFDNVNRGATHTTGAIDIFIDIVRHADGPVPAHRNITLSDNLIRNTQDSAIFIGSSSHVQLNRNIFENVSQAPLWIGGSGISAVYVRNSSDISGTGNELRGTFSARLGQENSSNVTIDPF